MLKQVKEDQSMSIDKEEASAVLEGMLYLEVSARLYVDPTELMEKYTGRLILETGDEDYLVGKTQWWIVRVNEMLCKGQDLFMMMDGEDEATSEIVRLLGEDFQDWSQGVYKLFPDIMFGDVTVLDRVVVNPPFRGKNIGLHGIEMIMRITGGMELFVLKPFPLQHSHRFVGNPTVAKEKSSLEADRGKLITYYQKSGFKRVPGTDLLALDPRVITPNPRWEGRPGEVNFCTNGGDGGVQVAGQKRGGRAVISPEA